MWQEATVKMVTVAFHVKCRINLVKWKETAKFGVGCSELSTLPNNLTE
jgi:hypothetical protein